MSPTRALVLGGGGARGAYEAGALGYLLEALPERLGTDATCDIVLGTSVGAVHACYMGAVAGGGPDRWSRLREHWLRLHLDDFVRGPQASRFGLLRRLLRARRGSGATDPRERGGWLDITAMREIVQDLIPWEQISRNVESGVVRAVGVAATELATGRAVVFLEGNGFDPALWAHDPTVVPRSARLEPAHPLASAALPLLFPAVRIGEGWYVDGGVRLNTPLAPAIHLGADRLLVITPRCDRLPPPEAPAAAPGAAGSPVSVLGRVLSALLLDHLETDLGRMHFVNGILERGSGAYGADFVERLNAAGGGTRELRRVGELVLRPSRDPGEIAAEVLTAHSGDLSRSARLLLDSLGAGNPAGESTLLSFLLFHPAYADALMQLGWADAEGRADELARFFSDDGA